MGVIADIIRGHAQEQPDATALLFEDSATTFAELDAASSRVAQALLRLGVGMGDRVGIISQNRPEFYEALIGCSKLGAICVPISWRLTGAEMLHPLDDAGVRILIAGGQEYAALAGAATRLSALEHVLVLDDRPGHPPATSFQEARDSAAPEDPNVIADQSDVALIFYTSGTSGRPKGVMVTEGALAQHLANGADVWGFDDDSVNLQALPLFHVGGCCWGFASWHAGACNVLLPDAHPERIVDAIAKHGVTHAFFVPTLLGAVLRDPSCTPERLKSLRALIYGGSPITEDLLRSALNVLDCKFYGGYGLTESTASVTLLPPEEHVVDGPAAHRIRSAGKPYPGVELRIVDPDNLAELPSGRVGEIWLRTPKLMKGYWGRPADTSKAVTTDGWLRTGDAGHVDTDGFLYVSDRIQDMIISGGENIYPAEVENAISSHPGVREVAVIGVPDPRWGESVVAFVVPQPDHPLESEDLVAFAGRTLARFKLPRVIEFVDDLPKNASGKVLKRELRAHPVSAQWSQ